MNKGILTIGLLMVLCSSVTQAQPGWYELGTGLHALNARHEIRGIVTDASGKVYATSSYTSQFYVAHWDGAQWTEAGTGAGALNASGYILTLGADAAGNVYAAGELMNSDMKQRVAKWNGSTWTDLDPAGLDAQLNESIWAMHVAAAGTLYVAGNLENSSGKYHVARWNGTSWSELGTGANALNANGGIRALWGDAAGNLYAAGLFTNSSGKQYVAKWDGSTWRELGPGVFGLNANGNIHTVTGDAFGNIYAAGEFTNSSGKYYVARWDGNIWSEPGTGATALNADAPISAVRTDAAGNVYAAGAFTNAAGYRYVARWNGSTWSELGAGLGALRANSGVFALHLDTARKKIYAGGDFSYPDIGGLSENKYVAVYDGVTSPPVDSIEVWTADGGPALITANDGTLDLVCMVWPQSTDDTVAWSIVPVTGTASIVAAGAQARVAAATNGTVWAKAVSLINPAMRDSLLITISNQGLGINSPGALAGLRLYPNPVREKVHIQSEQEHPGLSLAIVDGQGCLIHRQTIGANALKAGLWLRMDHLAAGDYYLIFSGPGIYYSYKLAKE
ncbi:hypothetical protein [Taibaiella koreensis]|uniref:hypothetical protein n=1 Tax=Taibaiella koreensis TaxID=1268548 RepID=UPI000E59F7C6|nr:hypothetical protein [Taibaiella koreensis]